MRDSIARLLQVKNRILLTPLSDKSWKKLLHPSDNSPWDRLLGCHQNQENSSCGSALRQEECST